MPQLFSRLLLCLAVLTAASLIGCDTSADRELRRAERAIDEALDVGADQYASEDYNRAEELLTEADELAKENRIQEAREVAIRAKLRAEDAKKKADEYQLILAEEEERLLR